VSADTLTGSTTSGLLNVSYVPGVPGLGGQAVSISRAAGAAAVLQAADSNDLDLSGSFTMEAYVQRTFENNQEWDRFTTKWFNGSNQYHWAFRDQGTVNKGQDLFTNGAQRINSATTIEVPLNEWLHVALTGDPVNGLRLWQDGAIVGTAAYVAPGPGTDPFRFGNFDVSLAQENFQFYGYIDDFQIHDVAQNAAYFQQRTALLNAVPEPASIVVWALAGLGLLGCGYYRCRNGRP
jgi:hypothetical protein